MCRENYRQIVEKFGGKNFRKQEETQKTVEKKVQKMKKK